MTIQRYDVSEGYDVSGLGQDLRTCIMYIEDQDF